MSSFPNVEQRVPDFVWTIVATGTRTRSAIAPKGAPFSTVNAWNALRHWNAVRVEISLDRIVVKVPKFKQIADRIYVRCVFGSKSREWCGIEKDSGMCYFI